MLESDNPAQLEAQIKSDSDVDLYFERGTMAITPEGKDQEVNLVAVGPGYEKVDWVISKGRLHSAPGEATVGKGFLDLMGADVGDTVKLTVLGKPLTLKIVGMYRATEDGGRWAMTSVETVREQIDPNLEIGSFAVALKDGVDSEVAADRYRSPSLKSVEVFDHAADGIGAVRAVLVSLGAMLLLVGLVSVVNTLSTGIRERHRDLGVLKAVGFTPRQLVAGVLTNSAIMTGIALVVGIPIGVWVSTWISDFIGNQLGWGPGLFESPPWTWLAAVVPAVAGAVALAALLPAMVAARLRAGDALRSE